MFKSITAAVLIIALVFWTGALLGQVMRQGECNAPCTVHFRGEEDDYRTDYTHNQLKVWVLESHQ